MPKKNSINGIHAQRLKAIRPFINFNYDIRKPLTRYQKRRIKTYFDEIDALTARPYHAYRPRIKVHLAKAQEFAQHEKRLPGLKVAFIPTNGIEKPKIRFDEGGDLIAETKHVSTRFLAFDPMELINDPKGHTEKVIKKDKHAKSFTILAGKFEIPNSYNRERVSSWVAKFAEKYSTPENNNYFGNWMRGLSAHRFTEQASMDDFRVAKSKNKKKLQRKRLNKKRRAAAAAEKRN